MKKRLYTTKTDREKKSKYILSYKSRDEISAYHMSEKENVSEVRNIFVTEHTLLFRVTQTAISPDKIHFYPQTRVPRTLEADKILFVSLLKGLVFCSVHSHHLGMCKWSSGSVWPWE